MFGGRATAYASLAGQWSGAYWYDSVSTPDTLFVLNLDDDGGLISGSMLEPATFGLSDGNLSARINGAREGRTLSFTKIYHPSPGVHLLPIAYTGRINSRLTVIKGSWVITNPAPWRGRFRMDRIANANDAPAFPADPVGE